MALGAGIVIVVILTTGMTWINRHYPAKWIVVGPLIGTILICGIAYLSIRDHDNYTQCKKIAKVDAGNVRQWFILADRLEARGLPADAEFLREEVNKNLIKNKITCLK